MRPPIRVAIIDDEPLARAALRVVLETDPEVCVVGDCIGVDAPALIEHAQVELVFLDVQMPEVDGFQVLEALRPGALPATVFVTAHDEYAVRAFEIHAIDYLLKPFDDARLLTALARAKDRLARPDPRAGDPLLALLAERSRQHRHIERFLVRTRGKVVAVRTLDIDWIEAADYYATLHVGGATHLVRQTMADLEALGISNDSRVVVYFADDWASPATRVVFTLDAAGLGARAALLDGGMPAWLRAGHPVSEVVPPARTGKLAKLVMRPLVVDAPTVLSRLGKPGFAVVDARDTAFYDGTQTGGMHGRPHRTGHIAGAVSIPYDSVFDDQLVLRAPDDLAARFTRAGVKPGDTVIGYCHIGQQATAMLFAARLLGHPARAAAGRRRRVRDRAGGRRAVPRHLVRRRSERARRRRRRGRRHVHRRVRHRRRVRAAARVLRRHRARPADPSGLARRPVRRGRARGGRGSARRVPRRRANRGGAVTPGPWRRWLAGAAALAGALAPLAGSPYRSYPSAAATHDVPGSPVPAAPALPAAPAAATVPAAPAAPAAATVPADAAIAAGRRGC